MVAGSILGAHDPLFRWYDRSDVSYPTMRDQLLMSGTPHMVY